MEKNKKKTPSKKPQKTTKSSKSPKSKDLKSKLEAYREKVLNTSWHHMQVESGVKGLIVELVDIIKEK